MKKTLLTFGAFAFSAFLFGQNTPAAIQRCATEEYMQYRESVQPGYIQATKEAFEIAKASQQGLTQKNNETLRIPVVVHIVYNEDRPEMNLDDEVIFDQIRILNEDFNRTNADTTNMREDFQIVTGYGLNVSFELADFDPEGNPTTGITRTSTSTGSFFDPVGMMAGGEVAGGVKSTADGGIDPWDQEKYLNIWVCNMALEIFGEETPMVLGYATPPANLPNWQTVATGNMSDGVVIQYQAFGSNNPNELMPNYAVMGRTVTHEVGHYLGLRHIWGDSSDCIDDDGIEDTPNATENHQESGCINKNTCTDDIHGVDLPDMYENYMDYSEETCQNSFTEGQIALMRGVLENQREGLVAEDNDALSIQEETKLNVAMYPNPTAEMVTLTSEHDLSGATITVVDLNGKIVLESTLNGQEATLNLTTLQSGVYQVFIEGMNGAKKLVKF